MFSMGRADLFRVSYVFFPIFLKNKHHMLFFRVQGYDCRFRARF